MYLYGVEEATGQVIHFFFFNDTATTEIYTLSLHDALPIYHPDTGRSARRDKETPAGFGSAIGSIPGPYSSAGRTGWSEETPSHHRWQKPPPSSFPFRT